MVTALLVLGGPSEKVSRFGGSNPAAGPLVDHTPHTGFLAVDRIIRPLVVTAFYDHLSDAVAIKVKPVYERLGFGVFAIGVRAGTVSDQARPKAVPLGLKNHKQV